ncbi:MAG: glycosyltransferase family 2 protein [Armatimonadota bacterium]|jgi:GT2 family glycosyltransferase
MDLCICIVSWNVAAELRGCLESVAPQGDEAGPEVIVVDNASSDYSVAVVGRHFPRVKLIENETNVGFAAAANQALSAGSGRYVLLLNPDCVVPEDALRRMVEFADSRSDAGLIGPKLVYPDGRLQHSCRRFPTVRAAIFRHTVFGRLFPRAASPEEYLMAAWAHDEVREVDWLSGACLMARREAIEEVGPLDEQFFWGSEDVDWAYRMHEKGWKALYFPEVTVVHAVGASTDQVVAATVVRTHRSMLRLYRKHFCPFALAWLPVAAGVWARAGLILVQHWLKWLWTRATRRLRRRRG